MARTSQGRTPQEQPQARHAAPAPGGFQSRHEPNLARSWFVQRFQEGLDRGGFLGKRFFLANGEVFYQLWKTPEATRSLV